MFESIAAAVAPSLIGGLLGGSSSGGGQQTVSRDPWAPAQDWMKQNIASGQNLQNQYAANPFSAYQQNAYGNSQQLSQGARSILAQILPQMSGSAGFDRNNPLAKPQGYTFSTPAGIGGNSMNLGFSNLNSSVDPAKTVQAAPAQAPQLSFAEQMAQYQRDQARNNRSWNEPGGHK